MNNTGPAKTWCEWTPIRRAALQIIEAAGDWISTSAIRYRLGLRDDVLNPVGGRALRMALTRARNAGEVSSRRAGSKTEWTAGRIEVCPCCGRERDVEHLRPDGRRKHRRRS